MPPKINQGACDYGALWLIANSISFHKKLAFYIQLKQATGFEDACDVVS